MTGCEPAGMTTGLGTRSSAPSNMVNYMKLDSLARILLPVLPNLVSVVFNGALDSEICGTS